jgi:hypothetical protein
LHGYLKLDNFYLNTLVQPRGIALNKLYPLG